MQDFNIRSRHWLIATLSALAFVCILSGYFWLANNKPISIAANVWLGYEPMFMARNEGWLNKDQVRLVETKSVAASLKALADGEVDGAALTLDEVLKARVTGLPLSVVMVFNVSAGADMLVVKPNIKNLSDLRGKRIGVEESSVGEVMLSEILQQAGLTKQDVTLVKVPVDNQVDAWARNQVDAAITYEPVASQLLAQHAVKIFDSRQIPNTIVDVLVMRSDKLDHGHVSALRHLISAHFRALAHLTHNPQDTAYRMATHLGLPASGVLEAYRGLLLPDADNNFRLLSGQNPKLGDTARKLSNVMVKANLLKKNDTLAALINADFLPTDF
ncbi:putative aliphatic sulfonates-binding protein precursor [mine drainage metagenome]|uniref:Putative aliphatic sulfonates-binding protein n=1 Tax=mine drainage metagenome TaxID=410659 RepID=A0A1J5TA87_9ZZZZ